MKNYLNKIKNSPLFLGISEAELERMLKCFNARIKIYQPEEFVIRQGDMVSKIFLILDGEISIEKDTYWGRRMIIRRLRENENIALSLVASKNIESNINAVCTKKASVLILDFMQSCSICENACMHHGILIRNLFKILAKENIELIEKIESVSQKTIRDKLLTYLSNESLKKNSNNFEICFNRQELADFLNIDRSALSFEMSKLKKEGLIDYKKNRFLLKGLD